MTRKYLAFDIETAKLLPTDQPDWRPSRPLGISCAATLLGDTNELVLWHGGTDRKQPQDRMNQQEAAGLVDYLETQAAQGYTIVTWNGVGFDLDILAEESGMLEPCRSLAVDHVDMMFHIVCRLGYPVGLDAAARGMGLPGKPEGMSGAVAPTLWTEGKRQEVLDYVAQDVRTTLALATECEGSGEMRWITRSGRTRRMALPTGWLSVDSAEQLPEPNTSWMDNSWSRTTFTGWLR
jgi:hypothetical protein